MVQPSTSQPGDQPGRPSFALIGALVFLALSIIAAVLFITGFDPASLAAAFPTPAAPQETALPPTSAIAAQTAMPESTEAVIERPRWVIRLGALSPDAPDITSDLTEAIRRALEDTSVDAATVVIEPVALGDLTSVSDIDPSTVGDGLLMTWAPADEGYLSLYILDARPPNLPTLDDPLAAWSASAPGEVPLKVSDGGDLALPARLSVAILEMWNGNIERAAGHFADLQSLPSDIPIDQQADNQAVINFVIGQTQAIQDLPTDAFESFSQSLRLRGDFTAAALNRANLYQGLGDSATALGVYQSAQANPFYLPISLYNTALAQNGVGDPAAATQTVTDLLAVRPGMPAALNLRGILAYQQGDFESALADFSAAVSESPTSQPLLINQAETYLALDQPTEAVAVYGTLIGLDPQNASYPLEQGAAYLAAGDEASASDAFNKAIALDNEYAAAYAARAELEFKQGNLNQAITDARQALTLDDSSGAAYRVIADSLLAQDEFIEAEENYSAAVERGVEDGALYAGRGWARHNMRRMNAAIDDYVQAIALGVDDPVMLMRLGFAYYDVQREEDALAAFERARDGGLDTPEARAGLAIALDANLKRDEADALYAEVLEADPRFADRDYLEGLVLWSSNAIGRAMSIVNRLE